MIARGSVLHVGGDGQPGGKWAGRAHAYAETFAGQCAHTVPVLLDALDPRPGSRLLDVGIGAGAVAAAAVVRGCVVTAVDPAADMLDLAALAAPRASLARAALPDLPFPDGAFDLVSANFVLNHVPDPRAAAGELARVLAPAGRVAGTVWPDDPTPLRRLWDDVVRDAGVQPPRSVAPLPADLDFPRTPDGLAGLLSAAGLRVERAWLHEFTHVVEPDLWWSGVTRGVANIGQTYLAQDESGRTAMTAAFDRLSAAYLHADGLLHLAGAAVMALGVR